MRQGPDHEHYTAEQHRKIAKAWRDLRAAYSAAGEHEEAGTASRNANWHEQQADKMDAAKKRDGA